MRTWGNPSATWALSAVASVIAKDPRLIVNKSRPSIVPFKIDVMSITVCRFGPAYNRLSADMNEPISINELPTRSFVTTPSRLSPSKRRRSPPQWVVDRDATQVEVKHVREKRACRAVVVGEGLEWVRDREFDFKDLTGRDENRIGACHRWEKERQAEECRSKDSIHFNLLRVSWSSRPSFKLAIFRRWRGALYPAV